MQCQNCGHQNQAGVSFCAKCIEPLDRSRAKLVSGQRVFLPPQAEHIVQPQSVKRPSAARGISGWVLFWILAVILLLVVLIYG